MFADDQQPAPEGGWGFDSPPGPSDWPSLAFSSEPRPPVESLESLDLPPFSQNWLLVPFNSLNCCLKEQQRKCEVDFNRLKTFVDRIERRVLSSGSGGQEGIGRPRRSRLTSDTTVTGPNCGRRARLSSTPNVVHDASITQHGLPSSDMHQKRSGIIRSDISTCRKNRISQSTSTLLYTQEPTQDNATDDSSQEVVNLASTDSSCRTPRGLSDSVTVVENGKLSRGASTQKQTTADVEAALEEFAKNIERALEFLQKIAKKLKLAEEESQRYINKLHVRLKVLEKETDVKLCHENLNFNFDYYTRTIDCILHEFFGRRGLLRTAAKLCNDYNLYDLVDSEVHQEAGEIANSLRKHETQRALDFCATHHQMLLQLKSPLEAQLHLQHLIELSADMLHQEALQYVQTSMQPELLELCPELRQAITLLAFSDNPPEIYKHLLSHERWVSLEEDFKKTFAAVFGFSKLPVVEVFLQSGLSALKSEGCEENLSPSCPTCHPLWQNYVKTLPTLNRLHTHLICPISGEVMSDSNPPLASPEGCLYSTNWLSSLSAASADGLIESPRSSKRYPMDRFQRIFIS